MVEKPLHREVANRLGRESLEGSDSFVLSMAEMYEDFPPIQYATDQMIGVLETKGRDPYFSETVSRMLRDVQRSVDVLQASLDFQIAEGLGDHKWKTADNTVTDALRRGVRLVEFDIRMDADGEFWVSHGPKDGMVGRKIGRASSRELADRGRLLNLDQVVEEFARYAGNDHKLLMEIKELGGDATRFPEHLQRIEAKLHRHGVEEAVAVSSFSPAILMATHETLPNKGLILNGSIVPGISYQERPIPNSGVPVDERWHALKIGGLELVVGATEQVERRADSYAGNTIYYMQRLPNDLLDVLRTQRAQGKELGGMVSLGAVASVANMLDTFGMKDRATQMRNYHGTVLRELGIGGSMVAWAETASRVAGIERLSPQRQLEVFRTEFGIDESNGAFFSHHPELLAPEVQQLIQKQRYNESRS